MLTHFFQVIFVSFIFIYLFFGCTGSSLLCVGFFLQLRRAGATLLLCTGFSLWWLLLLRSTGTRCVGFSSWSTQAQQLQHAGRRVCRLQQLRRAGSRVCRLQQLWLADSGVWAHQLWRMGLVDPRHVGSSRIRDRTHVPCIGRRILNQWTTREVPVTFNKLLIQISCDDYSQVFLMLL